MLEGIKEVLKGSLEVLKGSLRSCMDMFDGKFSGFGERNSELLEGN